MAKLKIKAVMGGFVDALRRSMVKDSSATVCTMGDIFDWVNRRHGVPGENAVRSMRWVLKKVNGGTDADADAHSSGELNKYFARKYREIGDAELAARADQQGKSATKTTFNSYMVQALVVFGHTNLEDMRDDGLAVPDMTSFLAQCKSRKYPVCKKKIILPPDEVIAATLAGWRAMTDRNQFIAVSLMLATALRKSHVKRVHWGMFTRLNDVPMLAGWCDTKNQDGYFEVRPIDPFWRELNARIDAEGWRGQDGEPVLPGTPHAQEQIFRATSAWLRRLGWKTPKTNHVLREYSISQVTMRYGLQAAFQFACHSSMDITHERYSSFVDKSLDPAKILIDWAKSPNVVFSDATDVQKPL